MIGKIVHELPPSPENNRNSEGSFITLKNGNILYIYSRFSNKGWADHAEADLYGILSEDGGESFGSPFPVLCHTQIGASNIMSVSLLRMQNGDIGMFFLAKNGTTLLRCYLIRSPDEGKTWLPPVLCSNNEGYHVVNNDRVLRCDTGRLLIPASLHDTQIISGKTHYAPGKLTVFASDDDGFTWKALSGGLTVPVSRGCTTGAQEPGLVQLKDGSLWCFIRTNAGRQYETFSHDSGETWTQPQPSPFTSPEAPLSMKRLRDGRLLAVWNPIPLYNGRILAGRSSTWARTPLVMAVSTDDGASFSQPIPLETDPDSSYCYTAIHETDDDALLLAYCAGSTQDACTLNRLRIRKIPLTEL